MQYITTGKEKATKYFEGVKKRMEGESCRRCTKSGVECEIATLFKGPAKPGQRVFHLDGTAVLRMSQPISQCEVVLGKRTPQEMAEEVRKRAPRLPGMFLVDEW